MSRKWFLFTILLACVAVAPVCTAYGQGPEVPCLGVRPGSSPDCKCCTTRTTSTTTTNGCGLRRARQSERPVPVALHPKKQIYLYVKDMGGYPVRNAVIEITLRAEMPGSGPKLLSDLPPRSPVSCVTDDNGLCSVDLDSPSRLHMVAAICRDGCLSGSSEALVLR